MKSQMSEHTVQNDNGQAPLHTGYPAQNYQITPEEMQVLDKCNWESFIKRCLPISSFLGVSAAMAIKNGFLQPNARFGIAPKVTMAVVIGYALGKASYQRECAEMLMSLPNSGIGKMLRDKQVQGGAAPQPIHGDKHAYINIDSGCNSFQDIHTDLPQFIDNQTITDLNPLLPEMHVSEKTFYTQSQQDTDIITETRSHHSGADPLSKQTMPPIGQCEPRLNKNIYGDIID